MPSKNLQPFTSREFFSTLLLLLTLLFSPVAFAQQYAVGQRVECDPLLLKKYFKPGVVIAPNPGEKLNGELVGISGKAYRVRLDDGPIAGSLCPVDNMRPAGDAPAQANVPAQPKAAAVAGAGRFGTRAPQTCPAVRNLPTTAQIAMLVRCDDENIRGNLITLDEQVSVQAARTRKYNEFADGYSTGIDTDAPVLPIRGSLESYQCAALSRYTNTGTVYDTDNTGKNCTVSTEKEISGTCFQTTFGDWRCHLNKRLDRSTTRFNQPPPR